MIVFERIIDSRLWAIVGFSVDRTGFVKKYRPTDAIHAYWLFPEKQKDAEKTFDRVPRDLIWYVFRSYKVHEEFTN